MKRAPAALSLLFFGAGLVGACTPTSNNGGSGGRTGNPGTGGGTTPDGTGGTTSPGGTGGTSSPGSGGSNIPGSGGSNTPGSGGSNMPGSGGSNMPGSGGSNMPGSGGSSGGGGNTVPPGTFPSQACINQAGMLLSTMTADEKYGQVLMLERAQVTPQQVQQLGIGAVYSQGGSAPANNTPAGWADMIDAYRAASRQSRTKIPMFYGLDSVHGLGPVRGATIFPHNIGFGATRNVALAEQAARVVAQESLGVGADFPFTPVLAVVRDERWGRTYEGFGETPDLAASFGAAMVKGLQFTSGGTWSGVLANLKHYVGDGGTAMGSNLGNTAGDEATIRRMHLDPYKPALMAKAGSVMASYSSWQGVRLHQHRQMLTDVLKGELGFAGFILSDYNGCFRLGQPSDQASMSTCLNAGMDMFMHFGAGTNVPMDMIANMRAIVQNGTVPAARVDDAVRRILTVKCEMGLFSGGPVNRTLTQQVGSAANRMVARQVVRESLVVLKNDGAALPIAKTATIALAGKSATNVGNQAGGWTITWQGLTGQEVPGATSIRTALEMALGGASKVVYSADGSTTTGASVGVAVIGELPYSEGCGDVPPQADTFCTQGSAGAARPNTLVVDAADVAVVQKLKQAGLKTVVVLIAGRPMILEPLMQYADAIVVAWLPGSEGGGVADVLVGDFKPTGKLPHSWPRSMAQIPINMGDATYDPLYPFGHGLTY